MIKNGKAQAHFYSSIPIGNRYLVFYEFYYMYLIIGKDDCI